MTNLMGDGEGHTVLILTDAESRLIREAFGHCGYPYDSEALAAYDRGVQRGTEKVKAEFEAEQKKRKEQRK